MALVALLGWLLLGRRGTEEDQVRAVIDAIVAAVEERSASGVVAHLSDTFRGEEGLSKKELKGYLVARFLGSKESISIARPGRTEVTLRGPEAARTSAVAAFRARISDCGAIGAALEREAWDFEVDLRKEEGEWRVTGYRRAAAE